MLSYKSENCKGAGICTALSFQDENVHVSFGSAHHHMSDYFRVAIVRFKKLDFEYVGDGPFVDYAKRLCEKDDKALPSIIEYVLNQIGPMSIFDIAKEVGEAAFKRGSDYRSDLIKEALGIE